MIARARGGLMPITTIKFECAYQCQVHSGTVEWHHPIEGKYVGMNLCQLHHSLIQGRKKRDYREIIVNKGLEQMRAEVKELERQVVILAGCNPSEINKH